MSKRWRTSEGLQAVMGKVKWTRRHKWIVAAAVCAVVLLVALGIARSMLSARVLEAIQAAIGKRYGVEARADDLSLSLMSGTAAFEGFRIVDGQVTVIEAERVEVTARVRDVLDGRIDCAKLVVVRPVLRLFVEADGRTNLARILATPFEHAPGPEGIVVLRDARVEDGRVEFDDAVTDAGQPLRVVLRDVRCAVAEMQLAGDTVTESSADFRVDGLVEQPGLPARLAVVGWGRSFGGAPTFSLHAAITGFDLSRIPQYASAAQRAAIGGDLMHFAADIEARGGVIEPGAVVGEVAGAGTVLPLRVGGTTSDPVFDISSPLGTLLNIPLSRAGRFGEVAIGAGWNVLKGGAGAVADLGTGVAGAGTSLGEGLAGAGGDLVSGDPLGALESAGGGVVGVGTSLGKGLIAGATSLFGGGTHAVNALVGADAARIDEQFAELHATRRLAMLRAALASVPEGVASGRRKRIAAEIKASAARPKGGAAEPSSGQ